MIMRKAEKACFKCNEVKMQKSYCYWYSTDLLISCSLVLGLKHLDTYLADDAVNNVTRTTFMIMAWYKFKHKIDFATCF